LRGIYAKAFAGTRSRQGISRYAENRGQDQEVGSQEGGSS
jgi:hypothetical protein